MFELRVAAPIVTREAAPGGCSSRQMEYYEDACIGMEQELM
jgi:hypothetical protein